jgi:hypothetical protein
VGITVILGVLLLGIYYLSKFFFGVSGLQGTQLISGKVSTTTAPKISTAPPVIYEGGEFSVSFWAYVANWNVNLGQRKLLFQFGGKNFSTIVIGLGAFTNTLIVRVATSTGNGTDTAGSTLLPSDVEKLFKPNPPDDDVGSGEIGAQPVCDLSEIDLQRWVNVAVVISGRTCDVYIDGKLQRSCILNNYFKVDNQSPLTANVIANASGSYGFDGYMSNLNMYNYSLNPSQIYKNYMSGPSGTNTDVSSWFKSLITGTT